MTLVESMLEGYGFAGYSSSESTDSLLSQIQEATVSFIYTSSEILQECMTEDIIGQARVVTEGVDPAPLFEGVVANFFKKMWEAIKRFFTKIKNWIVGIFKKIKAKIDSWRNSKKKKAVETELDKHDKDEKIVPKNTSGTSTSGAKSSTNVVPELVPPSVPAVMLPLLSEESKKKINKELTSATYPVIEFNMERGIDKFSDIQEKLADRLNGSQELLDYSIDEIREESNKIDQMDLSAYNLESFKKTIEREIGCDPDNVESVLMDAFNANGVVYTELTVDMVCKILKDADIMNESISRIEKISDKVMDEMSNIENKWKQKASEAKTADLPQNVLQVFQSMNNCITYVCQCMVKVINTESVISQGYLDQVQAVSDYTLNVLHMNAMITTAA